MGNPILHLPDCKNGIEFFSGLAHPAAFSFSTSNQTDLT
jgi:hypothetical protein